MSQRTYAVSIKYISGTSCWVDCDSEEHVAKVIELAEQHEKPPASIDVMACLTADEISKLRAEGVPFGFNGGG